MTNNATQSVAQTTLVDAVTTGLGTVLGSLVDFLVRLLTLGKVNPGTSYSLKDLLDAKLEDESNLATGAFAGRVVGDVKIEKCAVTGDVEINSRNNRTGGFIGYSDGVVDYSGLSDISTQ